MVTRSCLQCDKEIEDVGFYCPKCILAQIPTIA